MFGFVNQIQYLKKNMKNMEENFDSNFSFKPGYYWVEYLCFRFF